MRGPANATAACAYYFDIMMFLTRADPIAKWEKKKEREIPNCDALSQEHETPCEASRIQHFTSHNLMKRKYTKREYTRDKK